MTTAEKDITAPEADETGISFTLDGHAVAAKAGELIIDAAERAGVYIPRFCYHPRMAPVGMCRMCLVEVSNPRGFSLQPACYLSVQDGQEVRTSSPAARKAQEGVIEFLLVNHPLDCPVCDKGGECPLQDQSMSHGPGESRFIEEKRHWPKPIDIGPFVALDRERCIQCARCTRFAEEIAGQAMIDFVSRGDQIEVATFPTEPFTSYFSGNTVQICPVGALTSRPYRFKSRPWDLEQVETTCTSCAVGCRVVAQSSAGSLVRYLGVDSDPVNQSWLCDKGRYGFDSAASLTRLVRPLLASAAGQVESTWHDALGQVTARLSEVLASRGPEAIAVIGGARLSNEEAYVWAKLAKGVLGTDSVDAQLGDGLPAEVLLGLPRATIDEATSAKLVVLLAPDLGEELPVLYLRLRSAARAGVKLLECSPVTSALSEFATLRLSYLPGELPRLAHALVSGGALEELTGISSAELEAARQLIALDEGGSPAQAGSGVVVVIGRSSLAESGESFAAAAEAIHEALPGAKFLSALRRANVHGALDMGLSPGVLPGRVSLGEGRGRFQQVWGTVPQAKGRDCAEILKAAAAGEIGVLILLGADPFSDFPDHRMVAEALEVPPFVVALATHPDATTVRADVVLPIAGEAERVGSTTNIEGRVTRIADKVLAPGLAWPAWVVAAELARHLGVNLGFENLESISEEIERLAPSHKGLTLAVLSESDRRDGVVVPLARAGVSIGSHRGKPRLLDPMATPGISSVNEQGAPLRVGSATPLEGPAHVEPIPSEEEPAQLVASPNAAARVASRLDAYSLRLVVRRQLYDAGTLVRASAALAPLIGAPILTVHPSELVRLGVAPGSQLRVRSGHGEIVVTAKGDVNVARNVAVLFANLTEDPAEGPNALIDIDQPATDIRLESL